MKLQAGDRIHYGASGVMEVLSPDSLLLTQLTTENAKSLVIKLSGCGADAILAADIDSLTEQSLLAWDVYLEAELLKIAHHGSKSSTCGRFLDAVSPEIAVISAGPLNRFSHPYPDVVTRLTDHNIAVYSTVRSGSLTFSNRNGRWNYIESPARKLIRQWKLDHV
ncbi:MAG: ComEC/Rec2 family competence protein [Calditrichota bacterium]